MVEYRRGTQEEWDALAPVTQPDAWDTIQEGWDALVPVTEPDAWDTIIDDVERGGVAILPYGDEQDLLSKRLAIGRGANKRGFRVDFRTGPDQMAVRRLPEDAIRPLEVEEPLRSHVDPRLRQEQAHAAARDEAVEGEATLGQMGGR